MPSNRFTKINIDRDIKMLVFTLAAVRGISGAKMLEQLILSGIRNIEEENKPAS